MMSYSIVACLIAGISAQLSGEGPCAGQTFGTYIPDPTDCSRFYHCTSATETLLDCPTDTYFDAVYNVCVFTLQADCTLDGSPSPTLTATQTTASDTGDYKGPCGPNDHDLLLPDPTDCHYFYNCVHGTNVREKCPSNLHFNPTLNVCDYPSTAGCILGNLTTTTGGGEGGTTTPAPTTPAIQEPCSGLEPETIGHPDDCTRFTYCYLGVPAIVKCPIGEYYSKDDNACIEASECPATTTTSTVPPTPGTQTPTTPSIPTAGTPPPTTTTPNPIIPPCSSYEPEFLPYENDCTRYIYCYNGLPIPMRCLEGEYFSEKDKICIKSSECPQGTTTPTNPTPTTTTTEKPTPTTTTTEKPTPTTTTTEKPTPTTTTTEKPTPTTTTTEKPTPTTTTTEKPKPTPPCKSFGVETYPVAGDCMKYIYCVGGYPYNVLCGNGQYYSQANDRCIFTDKCPQ